MPFDLFLKQHLVFKHNGPVASLWGVDMPNIPKDIVAGPFYYAEQNDCQSFD
jgi:hypothetical protein